MSTKKKVILTFFAGILILDGGIAGYGAYLGHNGLFEMGLDIGKYAFATIVGALVTDYANTQG